MKDIKIPAWIREVVPNFVSMLGANLIYEAVHKLHALGQSVSGMVFDSVAIATLFALLMFGAKGLKPSGDSSDV